MVRSIAYNNSGHKNTLKWSEVKQSLKIKVKRSKKEPHLNPRPNFRLLALTDLNTIRTCGRNENGFEIKAIKMVQKSCKKPVENDQQNRKLCRLWYKYRSLFFPESTTFLRVYHVAA
ncbi:hypothetical protein CEXT_472021 [Caerostris extrusa]|uniref:Uncharacterized protein n=1 Tax=Caerostris extrusa TaxID=172846 RepID=A0AAV4T3D4_CAEEX|nr:hypothetical protein CEXT_472021 [Caerostris extrusa]